MIKHTPGPWKVEELYWMLWVTPPNRNEAVICDISPRHPSKYQPAGTSINSFNDEDHANARLIAAAPELLEALHELLKAYRDTAKLWDPNMDDAFTILAHNAIAKAIGEKEAFL